MYKKGKKRNQASGVCETLSATVGIVIWECEQHSHPSFLEPHSNQHRGASHEEARVEQQTLEIASKQ